MKQETKNFIIFFVLLFAGGAVLQYIENEKADKLEYKIQELENKNFQLDADNLILKNQLCDIKKDDSDECKKVKARIELDEYIKEEVKRIYKENFEN